MKRCIVLLALLLSACSSRETLVVYSPHGPDILKDYEALFEAAYPEVDVQALDMGSQDVYNRISAERNRPACDVWWGAPSTMFMQAAEDGLLASYRPTWADAVAEEHKDARDWWYGTHATPLAIMFNDRELTMETAPKTWDELLEDQWRGRITLRTPLPSGTMRTFIGAMILRAGSDEAGIQWLKRLHGATKSYMESPQLLFDHVKRNEELVSVWIMPDIVLQRERNGYPFGFIVPPETPVLTEGIAIVEGAPHRAWAERFYEFVTTEEALLHQAQAYAKVPARTDIEPDGLPGWMVAQVVDAMPIDWKAFAAKEKEWCARWEREVYQAP